MDDEKERRLFDRYTRLTARAVMMAIYSDSLKPGVAIKAAAEAEQASRDLDQYRKEKQGGQ